jgi:hypothetical protein
LIFIEVKTSLGAVAPALSVDQASGAQFFVWSRLNRAANQRGTWAAADQDAVASAKALKKELEDATAAAGITDPSTLIRGRILRVTNLFNPGGANFDPSNW